MNVIALVNFHDNERGVDRKKGEEFVVTRERFEAINSVAPRHGLDAIVGEVVRTAEAPKAAKQTPESRAAKAPAKRRSTRKKAE